MGLFKFSSGAAPVAGNPVPSRFTIVRLHTGPRGVAVLLHYPDATSYEGRKVCAYLDATEQQLRATTELDPHFTDAPATLAPFARYEPTDAGWAAACDLVDQPPV